MNISEQVEDIIISNWSKIPEAVCVLLRDQTDVVSLPPLSPLFDVMNRFDVPLAFFTPTGTKLPPMHFHRSTFFYNDEDTFWNMLDVFRTHHKADNEKSLVY